MRNPIEICTSTTPDYIPGTGIQLQLINIRHLKAHHHENALEILYCLKGKARAHVAHDYLELSDGDLVTCDRDDIHNVIADDDNLCLVVHIDLKHPNYTYEEMHNSFYSCTTHPKYLRYPDRVNRICDLLLAAAYESSSNDELLAEKCEQIHLNIIDMMQKHFLWFSLEADPAEGLDKYADRFHQILGYIMDNYSSKITLANLSDTLYLNPAYISNFISRTTFDSLTDSIGYFRCYYAEKLLLETDLSVGEISPMVGFSSEKYFYKAFKKWWNITPLQHRKRYRRYAQIKEEYYEYSPSETRSIIKDYIADRLVTNASKPARHCPL